MRRRRFIQGIAAFAAWPRGARAQQPAKMLRVGAVTGQPKSSPVWQSFIERMTALGYQEGKNFALDLVSANSAEEFESAYRRFVNASVDVIVAGGPEVALKSALDLPKQVPVVMVAIDYDPLARGYVKSLARPGVNATGLALQQVELAVKRLQLFKDAFPDLKVATVLWDRLSSGQLAPTEAEGARLGLRLAAVELQDQPYDYDRALAQAPPDFGVAIIVLSSPFFFRDRAKLADLALRRRIPSISFFREMAEAGGLISYGASISVMYARAADYVDRIAKGAKPADLPIEQPTKFELVVNLKTAKAIGVILPPLLLVRADEVVE
jgi:putative ABC transport system substrate-binding protein